MNITRPMFRLAAQGGVRAPTAASLGLGASFALPSSPSLRSSAFSTTSRISASQASQQYDSLYSSAFRGQGAKSSRKKWYKSPTTLVLGFIPFFTLYLGIWQMQRLKWKVELIEELEDKLKRAPLSLPKDINASLLEALTFRLVQISGRFDYSRAIFMGPRVREGQVGYHVVVPFARDGGGGEVMVDRGFVPQTLIEGEDAHRRLKKEAIETSATAITAILPRVYPPNTFTPDNDAQKGLWFHANPQAMADQMSGPAGALPLAGEPDKHTQSVDDSYTPSAGVVEGVKEMLGLGSRGEPRVLPVFLEEIFTGDMNEAAGRLARGVPVGRAPSIELRNQHAVYAATWFSLSACTAVMFGILVKRGR